MAYQAGDKVGDYEITGILGAGGMGAVYKVRNVLSDRVEAMKVLLPDLTSNTDVGDRFLREIRVLGSLEHPNIAALRTAQRVDHQVLMIMECIDGLSLDALLARGTIPRDYQLSIVAQVLSALDYAHKRGIIHRDIKPSNIMVTPSGQVKLMDFGIAKLAADRKLTQTGSTLGSLYYMSPEQIQGAENVDARSDIYALGICFYEMVTGKRPFDAPSEYSLMAAHLNQEPRPPIQLDSSIPEPLNQIILMAIAKNPEQRFQSAAAMLGALNSVREQLGFAVGGAATQTLPNAPAAAAVAGSEVIGKAPRSRRGVFMALGSLVTAGVVVGALLLAPRYFRTGASAKPPVSVQEPATAPPPELRSDPKPVETPVDTTPPAPQRSTVPEPRSTPPIRAQSRTVELPQPAPRQSTASPRPLQPEPSQPPPSQPQPRPREAQNPAPAPNAAALNEIREQYNQLAIRAGTAKSGLQSLQNQMGGMGLRADMRENAARMDVLMGEAMASIRAGDIEGARRNIDMADRTIEKLEKFLGR